MMKKLLLSLGAIAAISIPVATTVACGTDKPAKIDPNPGNASMTFDFTKNNTGAWHQTESREFEVGDTVKLAGFTKILTADDVAAIGLNPGDMSIAGAWMTKIIKVVIGENPTGDRKAKALAFATEAEKQLDVHGGAPSDVLIAYIASLK